MGGSIERIWLALPKRTTVSAMALVITINNPDPTHRTTGYGGVVPLPGPAATVTAAPSGRVDPLLQQRRDVRAARGRVLYAAGHAPRDTAASRTAQEHKAPCPEQRIGQGRSSGSMPNS
jgi:hypothetical protein